MREDLLSLHFCNTDAALYDLALAATFNGKADWLASTISADQASPFAWRQKRAIVLSGFMSKNVLPVASAWIDGEVSSSYEALKRKSARLRSIEACAHDWWQVFLASKDSETAYAAWILFLRSADRRAHIWMRDDARAVKDTDLLFHLKLAQVELNRQTLKREMQKHVERLDTQFLDRKIVNGVGPWGNEEQSP